MASKSQKRRRKRRQRSRDAARQASAGAAGEERLEPDRESEPKPRAATGRSSRRPGNPDDEAPPAPWGSFPLVELAVLVGIVMIVLGLFFVDGTRSGILLGTGLLLASIGGLELAIREHFAGYRSHTMLLAGVPAAAVLALLFYAGPDGLPPIARAGIGLAVYAVAGMLLVRIFRDRSGGHSFRFSGLLRR